MKLYLFNVYDGDDIIAAHGEWAENEEQARAQANERLGEVYRLELVEEELPVTLTDDPRIGREAVDNEGMCGVIESVRRFPDGTEHFSLYDEVSGIAHGGLTADQFTFV